MPTLPNASDRGKHPARTTVVDRRAEALGIPADVLAAFGAKGAAGGRLRTPLLGDDLQTRGGHQDRLPEGKKLSAKGMVLRDGHAFAPAEAAGRLGGADVAVVCEGLTDAAVATHLLQKRCFNGVAIGSVSAALLPVTAAAVAGHVRDDATLVIVADGDPAGAQAAAEAAQAVAAARPGLRVGVVATARDLDEDTSADRDEGADALLEALLAIREGTNGAAVALWPSGVLPSDTADVAGGWAQRIEELLRGGTNGSANGHGPVGETVEARTDFGIGLVEALDPTTGEPLNMWGAGQPEDWPTELRSALRRVAQWADWAGVSPWALLGGCLARAVVSVPLAWRLPGPPTAAPLGLFVANVGPVGAGKTSACTLSRDLLDGGQPIGRRRPGMAEAWGLRGPDEPLDGWQPSSGEGLVQAFMDWGTPPEGGVGRNVQTRDTALIVIDEIAHHQVVASRNGSTLADVLRTLWSGGALSSHSARAETTRHIPALGVRASVIAGSQPALAHATLLAGDAEILGDAARWIMLPATRSGEHRQRRAWDAEPGTPPPRLTLSSWGPAAPTGVGIDAPVRQAVHEVRMAALYAERPPEHVAEEWDRTDHGDHTGLQRLRVAAGLALIAGLEARITPALWHAAGTVLTVSHQVRAVLADLADAQHQADAAARRRSAAAVAVEVDQAVTADRSGRAGVLLDQAARTIARKALRDGSVTRRDARHAVAGRARTEAQALGFDLLAEGLDQAVSQGWIAPSDDGWTPGHTAPDGD